jgi:histidine triad (HIT) family protein
MISRAPEGYECPICRGIQGFEEDKPLPKEKTDETKRKPVVLMKQADFVYRDDLVSAFINSFWIPTCEGHVIVVPNEHYENIYEMPDEVGHRIFEVVKKISIAMKKAYKCDGITARQNNEPAGDQHAFHYHHHIFPRYDNDSFNINLTKRSILSDPKDRVEYAEKLKK